MRRRIYTFEDHLKESLKDPEFQKAWEESLTEYQISRAMIAKRIAKRMSQKELANKVMTTQAVISRIENMSGNPTIGLLKRIASAFGLQVYVNFK